MVLVDKHTHTNLCDGNNTAEEMVQAAIAKGLKTIGFSGHSYTAFDLDFCMTEEATAEYIRQINELKEKYADQIEILLGIEQDQCATYGIEDYDYAIGSTHYIWCGDEFFSVDYKAEILQDAADRYFDGDMYSVCELYFQTEAEVIEKTGADIIGHFDLISKVNEKDHLFDEHHPRYVAAWQKAADKLLESGRPFEINTGAISRGYRTQPYPSLEMIEYLKERGASFVLASDSHNTETLCYDFDKYEKYL